MTRLLKFSLLALLICAPISYTQVSAEPSPGKVYGLNRNAEIARLRLRLYQRQEYPLKRRKLADEISLTKAELESLKRRDKEYSQFTKFKYSAPLFDELERVKLATLETQLRLNQLIEEKALLERYHADRLKLMNLELESATETLLLR